MVPNGRTRRRGRPASPRAGEPAQDGPVSTPAPPAKGNLTRPDRCDGRDSSARRPSIAPGDRRGIAAMYRPRAGTGRDHGHRAGDQERAAAAGNPPATGRDTSSGRPRSGPGDGPRASSATCRMRWPSHPTTAQGERPTRSSRWPAPTARIREPTANALAKPTRRCTSPARIGCNGTVHGHLLGSGFRCVPFTNGLAWRIASCTDRPHPPFIRRRCRPAAARLRQERGITLSALAGPPASARQTRSPGERPPHTTLDNPYAVTRSSTCRRRAAPRSGQRAAAGRS